MENNTMHKESDCGKQIIISYKVGILNSHCTALKSSFEMKISNLK